MFYFNNFNINMNYLKQNLKNVSYFFRILFTLLLQNTNTSIYQRIFNTMTDSKPSVFTKSNDEGVERVRKGKRKYAFFMESTSIEYQIERHCELEMVGTLLDNKGYGIAMPPSKYT
jgi:hypothetical protein